jgi:hypothetical protein
VDEALVDGELELDGCFDGYVGVGVGEGRVGEGGLVGGGVAGREGLVMGTEGRRDGGERGREWKEREKRGENIRSFSFNFSLNGSPNTNFLRLKLLPMLCLQLLLILIPIHRPRLQTFLNSPFQQCLWHNPHIIQKATSHGHVFFSDQARWCDEDETIYHGREIGCEGSRDPAAERVAEETEAAGRTARGAGPG